MIYVDLFSGIGGFPLGLKAAGFHFDKHYFSEIDKHAIANYKYNFPDAEYIGSVTDVRGFPCDLITFGWPCQDNSIAGKRKGNQAGSRSGLLTQAVRIISECRPGDFIAENVEGLRTVNKGIDIIEAIKILAFLNSGLPQYDIEMQLLNTSWFLPQNRERLYFVGHLRNGSSRRIFPIGETNELSNESNDENGYKEVNLIRWQNKKSGAIYDKVAPSLRASGGTDIRKSPKIQYTEVKQLNLNTESGGKQPYQQNRVYSDGGIIPALMKDKSDLLIVAQRGRFNGEKNEQRLENRTDGLTNSLTSVTKDNLIIHNMLPRSSKSGKGGTGHLSREDGNTYCLDTGNTNAVEYNSRIRRLTEIECERLQGFPDNHTQFGNYDGVIKKIPKTQRYKMCGNAVTVKVVEVVGKILWINNYPKGK